MFDAQPLSHSLSFRTGNPPRCCLNASTSSTSNFCWNSITIWISKQALPHSKSWKIPRSHCLPLVNTALCATLLIHPFIHIKLKHTSPFFLSNSPKRLPLSPLCNSISPLSRPVTSILLGHFFFTRNQSISTLGIHFTRIPRRCPTRRICHPTRPPLFILLSSLSFSGKSKRTLTINIFFI